MSLRSILVGGSESDILHVRFPETPKIITVEGYGAFEYIQPKLLDEMVEQFSARINLNRFKKVFYNLRGGEGFAYWVAQKTGYGGLLEPIEYHPDNHCPTRIDEKYKNDEVAVFEDVLDTSRTTELIRADASKSTIFYLTVKMIPGQIIPPNTDHVVKVDNVWIFGGGKEDKQGMNGDTENDKVYPVGWGRSYEGIGVRISD
ncbi:MAG TPA: hypothetical protein VFI61_01755 [Patescibacteria group bacterium]|nr:hypothetical protein [Patescibacteria group bacterium]